MRSHHRIIVSAVALALAACVSLPETQTNPPGAAGDGGGSGVGGSSIAGNVASGGAGSGGLAGASGSGTAGTGGTSGNGTGGSQGGGAAGDGGVGGSGAGAGAGGAGGAGGTGGTGGAGGANAGAGGTGGATGGGAGASGKGGTSGAGAGGGGNGGTGGAGSAGKGGTAGTGAGSGGVAGGGGSGGIAAGSGGTAGGLVELAEGRTATANSEEVDTESDPPKDNTADKGNDGDPATRWCAADGMSRYWQVDLGATHVLSRIEIDFEYPAQAIDSAYEYVVAVSTDGTTFTPVIDRTDNTDTMMTQTASFPASTSGRHVRVTVTPPATTPGTWASLWEARIFGQ